MSIFLALPSALTYGLADFAGGLAARRTPVLLVTAVAQAAGFVALLLVVWALPGTPSLPSTVLGVVAGLAGAVGLLLYLRALAVGPMGVIAPMSAVVGAGLPLVAGVLGGERPGTLTLVAIVIALLAILMPTAGTAAQRFWHPMPAAHGHGSCRGQSAPRHGRGRHTARAAGETTGPLLGLGAGLGFGLFFIGMDAAPVDSGIWPLLAGRCASMVLLAGLVLRRGPAARPRPERATLGLMVLSGVTDTVANVLFLLAARVGDLGVTAVVVSLYPVVVVLLARIVLRERLTGLQLTGAGLAIGASVLLAASG